MFRFNIKSLTQEQKDTRKRILEVSSRRKLSHLGSCLSSVDLIDAIYKVKEKNEKFVLSNGHTGIALYVILEKNGLIKNPDLINKLNVHPDKNLKIGISVSTGSLGQGLPIALGMAFANKNKNVYCLISDGECTEGSIWETLRISTEKKISNLKIVLNANGWGAYDPINVNNLVKKLSSFGYEIKRINGHNMPRLIETLRSISVKDKPTIIFADTTTDQFPFLKGLDAHYYIMKDNDYKKAIELLK